VQQHLVHRLVSTASVRLRHGLGLPTVAVGVLGGLIGAAYVGAMKALTRGLGPDNHSHLVQLGIFVAVGLAVAVITRIGGETGNVELLVDNIHVLGGAENVRGLRSLIPASLLCVASGAGMGPEAPLVQTTGTVGTIIGSRFHRSTSDIRILTITGMAAGFTVLFGAPLGSALFALEILHRRGLQYYEALIPAVVGSLCGYGVYLGLSGLGVQPIWNFPMVSSLRLVDLAIAVGMGLIGAIGAIVFTAVSHLLQKLFGLVPTSGRYVLGGLALGLLGIFSPYALTFGEAQVTELLNSRVAAGALGIAIAAKLLGTTVTLASGWKGGFIIPLFFMGSAAGQLAHIVLPGTNVSVLMASAMVAFCVGVTKTPIGSTLVVTEMAGLPLLPVSLIGAVVSILVTNRFTLIHTQRSRGGLAEVMGLQPNSDLVTESVNGEALNGKPLNWRRLATDVRFQEQRDEEVGEETVDS
jgi:H+/Cl- antiporter ClcA